ncbi:hypothetical protein CHS0354_033148, partial [Potamilus streckersoni]
MYSTSATLGHRLAIHRKENRNRVTMIVTPRHFVMSLCDTTAEPCDLHTSTIERMKLRHLRLATLPTELTKLQLEDATLAQLQKRNTPGRKRRTPDGEV